MNSFFMFEYIYIYCNIIHQSEFYNTHISEHFNTLKHRYSNEKKNRSMRSLKQLFEHNIRDLITLNGDKAMNFFQAARRRNKRNDDVDDHVKIPTRLERLCRELPKIREELKQTGRFSFEMENFNGAMSGISPAKV